MLPVASCNIEELGVTLSLEGAEVADLPPHAQDHNCVFVMRVSWFPPQFYRELLANRYSLRVLGKVLPSDHNDVVVAFDVQSAI